MKPFASSLLMSVGRVWVHWRFFCFVFFFPSPFWLFLSHPFAFLAFLSIFSMSKLCPLGSMRIWRTANIAGTVVQFVLQRGLHGKPQAATGIPGIGLERMQDVARCCKDWKGERNATDWNGLKRKLTWKLSWNSPYLSFSLLTFFLWIF